VLIAGIVPSCLAAFRPCHCWVGHGQPYSKTEIVESAAQVEHNLRAGGNASDRGSEWRRHFVTLADVPSRGTGARLVQHGDRGSPQRALRVPGNLQVPSATGGRGGANWELKRGLVDGITDATVDRWYESALEAGATAGKILGAGQVVSRPRGPSRAPCHSPGAGGAPRTPAEILGARKPHYDAGPERDVARQVTELHNVEAYLVRLQAAVDTLPRNRLAELGEMLYRAYRNEKQVFTLGNGGSAFTASHMAADLGKNTIGPEHAPVPRYQPQRQRGQLTALANDLGYENVFREQLQNLIRPGDLLIAISGSGNSANVVNAIRYAQEQCAETACDL
jgi:phosphoheptose isomerase